MSDLSTYLGNKIARWLGGQAMPSAPASIYVALFNGDPKTSGVEVTTTIRPAGRLAASWNVPASGTDNIMDNSADVDFGAAQGAATVSYAAIYDAASAGNLLATKQLSGGPFNVTLGTVVKFLTGDLIFTIGD